MSDVEKADKAVTENKAVSGVSDALSAGYSEGLCGCLSDIVGCKIAEILIFAGVLVFCLPCFPMSAAKATLDERSCTFCDFVCPTSQYQIRQTIRSKYKLGVFIYVMN